MTKKRKIVFYSLICLFVLSVLSAFAVAFNKPNTAFASEIFECDGKVKTVAGDSDNGNTGLRLYAYDNGATARFKGVRTGIFQSEIKVASSGKSKDLKKYSLSFKDERSGKSFSVQISAHTDYNDAAVVYDGVKGGIVYQEASNAPYGVTAGYNEQDVYTRFSSDVCSLTFDPESMQVKVKSDDGSYRLVWDLKKQYNDGKLLANDFDSFKEYSVSVVFDEITANSRGDLLLCSFGGYSLKSENVKYRPSIILSSEIKPVAGKEYKLPEAKATGENGDDVSDKISASVYDESGKLLAKNVKTYTPAKAGTLYLYYEYAENGETSDAWYKAETVELAEITGQFVYDGEIPEKAGLNAKILIPKASVVTNVAEGGVEECLVTIKKNGKALSGYEKTEGGFLFRLTEVGVYEIEYSGKKSAAYNTEVKRVAADETTLAVNVEEIPEDFAVGAEYEFPTAEFCLGDAKQTVSAKIVTPDGEEKSGKVKFLDSGKYALEYSAVLNGENHEYKKCFSVKRNYADEFDTDAVYSSMRANHETKGVKLTLTDNNTVTYGKTIDLSKYSFNDKTNKGKTLLKLSFDPKNVGSPDLDSFFVVLTDKYDASNYISVRLKYLSYTPVATLIRARASEQTAWVGYYYDFFSTKRSVDSAIIHEEGGFVSSGSFTHKLDNYEFDYMSLNLFFDYETKCLYSQPLWLTGHNDIPGDNVNGHPEYNSTLVPWLVYDFDSTDSELSAGNKPWKGFTTGEAILSVYAKGASSGADVFMLTIDGEDMSEPLFEDKENPIITVDADENAVPVAKVGKPYKIFDYTATDADSKIVDKGVVVTNDASGRAVEVSADGTFTPIEGTYTVKYYAVDSFGHRAEKTFRVTAKRNVDEPELTVDSSMPSEAKYGDELVLADYEIANEGAGRAKVEVDVKCGSNVIPVTNGKFECKGAVGTYTVTYTITDYIGQTKKVRKRISVTRDNGLRINEESVNLPKAFISGDKFVFDKYYAVYYDENLNEITVPSQIVVTDGNGKVTIGDDGLYSPKATESVTSATVEVSFVHGGLNKVITRVIPVRTAKNGDGYIDDYFVNENSSLSTSSSGVLFTSKDSAKQMSFSFARPIYAKETTLRFIAETDSFNAESFEVILSDKRNGLQKIVLKYVKIGSSWYCSVGSGEKTLTYLDSDGYLQIKYDDATRTFTDAKDSVIGVADKTAAGLDFEGFSSGYVYLDCKVNGIKGKTELGIRTINNQTINSVKRDMQKPYIKADDCYEGRTPVGSVITFGAVTAYDVLSSLGEVKVSVKCGTETFIAEKTLKEGETFTVSECGKYRITFKVTDKNGNSASDYAEFSVYDPIKPELTFDGEIPGKVKVGESVRLPGYSVSDDKKDEVAVRTYVMLPDGTRESAAGEYTFAKRGTYVVVYVAADPNNNVVTYRFIVKAE